MVFHRIRTTVCRSLVIGMACAALPSIVQAQTDTLRLSLQQTEKVFLDSNLSIMAAHYNVDAARALVQQAKYWDNPILVTDQNVYADGKFFQHGKVNGQPTGQVFVQVQQLIKTAGKRNKLVAIASTNVSINELQLQELLRDLRYQLRSSYYSLYAQLRTLENLRLQQVQLQRLQSAMSQQLQAGNIAKKDFIRIQALGISLEQDIAATQQDISASEADLKTLLHIGEATFVLPAEGFANSSVPSLNIDELANTARSNNPGYLLQQRLVTYQQQNLAYQQSLKVPDVTVAPEFDHINSYAPNYFGLTLSLPLPIFNKNQGNIKAAAFAVKQQQVTVAATENELWNRISSASQRLLAISSLNTGVQQQFYTDYRLMYEHMLESYRQKQVNLLEFLDFFNTYQDSQARLLDQQLRLQLAKEELNYNIGKDIIK